MQWFKHDTDAATDAKIRKLIIAGVKGTISSSTLLETNGGKRRVKHDI